MRVEVRNGNVDRALKTLKKKMFDEGTIETLMTRRYYEKPSVTRRKKKLDAIRKQEKALQREQLARQKHAHKNGAKA
jgi:small subunit ribosomal protein S21